MKCNEPIVVGCAELSVRWKRFWSDLFQASWSLVLAAALPWVPLLAVVMVRKRPCLGFKYLIQFWGQPGGEISHAHTHTSMGLTCHRFWQSFVRGTMTWVYPSFGEGSSFEHQLTSPTDVTFCKEMTTSCWWWTGSKNSDREDSCGSKTGKNIVQNHKTKWTRSQDQSWVTGFLVMPVMDTTPSVTFVLSPAIMLPAVIRVIRSSAAQHPDLGELIFRITWTIDLQAHICLTHLRKSSSEQPLWCFWPLFEKKKRVGNHTECFPQKCYQ